MVKNNQFNEKGNTFLKIIINNHQKLEKTDRWNA